MERFWFLLGPSADTVYHVMLWSLLVPGLMVVHQLLVWALCKVELRSAERSLKRRSTQRDFHWFEARAELNERREEWYGYIGHTAVTLSAIATCATWTTLLLSPAIGGWPLSKASLCLFGGAFVTHGVSYLYALYIKERGERGRPTGGIRLLRVS